MTDAVPCSAGAAHINGAVLLVDEPACHGDLASSCSPYSRSPIMKSSRRLAGGQHERLSEAEPSHPVDRTGPSSGRAFSRQL